MDSLSGVGLVLVSCVGGGAVVVLARLAYDGGSNAPTSLLVRFALAGALLWLLLVARGHATRLPARIVWRFLLMGCFFTASATSAFMAIERIPASLATLVYYAYPAIASLGSALLFGTRVTPARAVVLAAALAGVGLTLDVRGGAIDGMGLALALASAVFYAGYLLAGSRAMLGIPPLVATVWILTAAFVLMLPIGASGVLGARFTTGISLSGLGALLLLAIFSTVVTIATFLAGMERIGMFRAAVLSTLEPVIGVSLSVLVLDERLSMQQAIGGAVIVGAALALHVIARREARQRRPAAA
jgi:drug/metabolite transporter (DMT)-like permease